MYLFDEDRDSYPIRPDTPDQRKVYNYVRGLAELPSQEAIEAFYLLLWHSNAHPRDDVRAALHRIVAEKEFEEHKLKIINRCYYTLVNLWHLDGSRDHALATMVLRLESLPQDRGHNVITRSLRDALRTYRDSEYYPILKNNLYLLKSWDEHCSQQGGDRHFEDLFSEYFFIYEAGAQTCDIENAVGKLNDGILQKRDQKLEQYRQELGQFINGTVLAQETIPNPTQQLTHDELCQAIKLYHPKRQNSFKSQVETFKSAVQSRRTVGECKTIVYQHVMQPLHQLGSDHQSIQSMFGREFSKVLQEFEDDLPMTRMVEIQIFSRLLNAIVRYDDTAQGEERFHHIVAIAKPQVVTSILLKIILTCRMVRFELEKRFAYLYYKFSKNSQGTVRWLVEAFDHMNVALALNAKHLNYFTLNSSHGMTIPYS